MKRVYIYDEIHKKMVEQYQTIQARHGINVMEHTAPDGSKLENSMSRRYIEHIRSRTKDSVKRMKPNMGAYGA